jgi:hypothetical protein
MDRRLLAGLAFALLVGSGLAAAPVCAQTPPAGRVSKPYQTLFGGNDSRIPSLHALDLNVSLDGGLDDGMYALSAPPADGQAAASQGFQQIYIATSELAYQRRGSAVNAELRGLASLPYYSLFPDESLTFAYGGSGIVSLTSRRTTVNAAGNFLHSPYYSAALDPSSGPGIGGGQFGRMSALNPTNEGTASTALVYKLGRRTSTTLGYSYYAIDFTTQERWNTSHSVNAALTRQFSRSVTATAKYGYRDVDYLTAGVLSWSRGHDIGAEFAYVRLGRRGASSSFRVSVGYSLLDDFGREYDAWPFSVHYDRAVGTRWSIAGDYSRSVQYFNAIQQPVWTDRVTLSANGYINARVQLLFDGNYMNGQRVLGLGRAFDTYWTSARVEVAVTQWAAVTAGYSYYRYDYPPGYLLPEGMPQQLDRQRVQVGARFWVPLARAGRSGAARTPDNP